MKNYQHKRVVGDSRGPMDYNSPGLVLRRGGYTLIEIIVVLTILVILFAVGYANYRSFQQRKVVDLVADTIISDLNDARNRALTGEKVDDSKCNSPETLTGYRFNETGTKYTISIICSGGNVSVKTIDIKDIAGTTNVSLSVDNSTNCSTGWTGGSNNVTFLAVGQGTDLASGACVRIKVSLTGSIYKYVYVDSSGTIR